MGPEADQGEVNGEAEGRTWAAIAEELGGTPDSRRVQLARASDRVSQQLGLEGGASEK